LRVRETAGIVYQAGMHDSLTSDFDSGQLVETLADLAEAASAVILPYWRAGAEVITKADDSPVTLADREAEALILQRLAALYPAVSAVAEEACEADGRPGEAADCFWLIDPLDGTKGFVRGGESFSVNIALVDQGRVVAGVVSAPATGLTWAGDASGARRRRFGEAWQPIRVRDRPDQALALLSHSLKDDEADKLAARYGCGSWTGMDSSLKFCLIAEGRFDVYPRTGPTSEWDTAAGQAVLEAAGGRVMDMDGGPLAYGKPGFMNGPFVAMGG
jgi:3'(2'), 5'-bisphosphate nucleotidase